MNKYYSYLDGLITLDFDTSDLRCGKIIKNDSDKHLHAKRIMFEQDCTKNIQLTEIEYVYPLYKKSKESGLVVKFNSLNSGEVIKLGNSIVYEVGEKVSTFIRHNDSNMWEDISISVVNFTYPIYKRNIYDGVVFRFDSLNSGVVEDTCNSDFYVLGRRYNGLIGHTDQYNWVDVDSKQSKINACKQDTQKGGLKFDAGKLRYSLVPHCAFKGMAEVLTFGAEKYEANSWQNVEDAKERYLNALYRHIESYRNSETKDRESGISHLSHAMTNCAFLLHFEELEATKNER